MQIPGPYPDLLNRNPWRQEHFQGGTLVSLVLLKLENLENHCSSPAHLLAAGRQRPAKGDVCRKGVGVGEAETLSRHPLPISSCGQAPLPHPFHPHPLRPQWETDGEDKCQAAQTSRKDAGSA